MAVDQATGAARPVDPRLPFGSLTLADWLCGFAGLPSNDGTSAEPPA